MKCINLSMMTTLLLIGMAGGKETPVLIKDWKELEGSLEDLRCGPTLSEFLATDALRLLWEQGDSRIFREMTTQQGLPLVRLAGFLALREKGESAAVASAIWLIVGVDTIPQQLLIPAYELLAEEPRIAVVAEELFGVAGSPHYMRPRTGVLVGVLPIKLLLKIVNDQRFDSVEATFAAIVLDRLIAENAVKVQDVRETLHRLAAAPGLPRQTYLLHTKDRDELFSRALTWFLEDVDTSNIQLALIVSRLKDEVAAIDLEKLHIDPQRRNHIRMLLEASK